MKDITGKARRVAALAIALMCCAPAVQAQETRFVDPAGVFSVDVAALDWRLADRAANPAWFFDDFIFLAYAGLNSGGPRNLCYALIDNRAPAPGPASRARLNEVTRQLEHSPTIENMRHDSRFRSVRADVVEIDGVAVLDIYGQFGSLDTIQRRFFMHREGELQMFTLSCSVDAADADAVASAHAIAGSLRFPREVAQ